MGHSIRSQVQEGHGGLKHHKAEPPLVVVIGARNTHRRTRDVFVGFARNSQLEHSHPLLQYNGVKPIKQDLVLYMTAVVQLITADNSSKVPRCAGRAQPNKSEPTPVCRRQGRRVTRVSATDEKLEVACG